MAYTRTTVIDATPSGDSVKQAVLDLDTDLTGAFVGLNQLQAALASKINQSEYDQPGGTPRLDASGRIRQAQLPAVNADMPVGMIAAFGAETLPAGCNWLECNGAELPVADYQTLYAAVGNAFGLAVNPANFKLPDLRGAFLRGWDHGRGKDPDAQARLGGDHVGSSQGDVIRKHCHPLGGAMAVGAGALTALGCLDWDNAAVNFYTGDFTRTTDRNLGQLDAHPETGPARGRETRPANTAVLFAIKWR